MNMVQSTDRQYTYAAAELPSMHGCDSRKGTRCEPEVAVYNMPKAFYHKCTSR